MILKLNNTSCGDALVVVIWLDNDDTHVVCLFLGLPLSLFGSCNGLFVECLLVTLC